MRRTACNIRGGGAAASYPGRFAALARPAACQGSRGRRSAGQPRAGGQEGTTQPLGAAGVRPVAGPAGPYQEKPEIWILCERFLFSILARMKKLKKQRKEKKKPHGSQRARPDWGPGPGSEGLRPTCITAGETEAQEERGLSHMMGPRGRARTWRSLDSQAGGAGTSRLGSGGVPEPQGQAGPWWGRG